MNTRCILLSLVLMSAVTAVCHAGATLYVAPNGSHTYPYATWAAAATNIQLAVNAALDGDILMVSNGVYSGYGAQLNGSNVVAINKLITMTSYGGAAATIIDGGGVYRCLYVRAGVLVRGFTLRNGRAGSGGGVYCYYGGNLENCTISRSSATLGGGVYFDNGGLVTNCALIGNAAINGGGGGGAYFAHGNGVLVHSYVATNTAQYGGGVACDYGGDVLGCTIVSNTASDAGGGVSCNETGTVSRCQIINNAALGLVNNWGGGGVRLHQGGTVISSLIVSNVARLTGGGVFAFDGGHVENCTVAANVATNIGGIYFQDLGGVYDLEVINSIAYFNQNGNINGGLYTYTCSMPGSMGAGNITNDPQFVNVASNDFHLQMAAPCVDTGTNLAGMAAQRDLDGNPRIMYGRVDLGAYETYRWMTLGVQSDAPSNNVTIACAPSATNGVSSAATPFALVFDALTEVALTAPATATNRVFDRWEVDGVSFGPSLVLTVQMAAAHVATAYYVGADDVAQVVVTTAASNTVARYSAVDLGVTSGSYTIARAFVISNSGTASLAVTSAPPVQVLGPWSNYFSISAQPASVYIPPKKTEQFIVLFHPPTTSNGSVTATIAFAFRAAALNPFVFAVTGTWRNFTPQPGAQVMATAGSFADRVHIWWPPSLGATLYELLRHTNNNMAVALPIATGPEMTNYTDAAVVQGQLYYYWVRTHNEYGQSVLGGPAGGYARLDTGAGVNASDGAANDRITIQWQSLPGATGYKLYRNTAVDTATMALIASPSATTYTDTGIMPGRTYYYWVRGTATAGDGALSTSDGGYAFMLPPTALSASGNVADGIMLWWPPAAGAASYNLYRNTTAVSNGLLPYAAVADPSYWDTNATPGAPYYYWVQAVAPACASALSTGAVGYAALATPTALAASDGIYTNKVALQWTGVNGALSYTVLRSTHMGSASPTPVATTALLQYDDYGSMPGTVYYYRVQANAAATSSSASLENSGYALFAVNANSWWLWHSKTKVRTKAFQLNPALGPFLSADWRVGVGTLSNGSFVVTHGPHALLPSNAAETLWLARGSGKQPFMIQYNKKNNRLIYNYVGTLPAPLIIFILPQSMLPGAAGLLTLNPAEPQMSVGFYLTPAPVKKRGGWMRLQAAVLDVTAPQDVQWMQQQR